MSSFDDRKKSFEKKFAHDEELQFKIAARRNKYLGQWASKILGYDEEKEKEYIQSVIKADFAEPGDEDVFKKVKEDIKSDIIKRKTKISLLPLSITSKLEGAKIININKKYSKKFFGLIKLTIEKTNKKHITIGI